MREKTRIEYIITEQKAKNILTVKYWKKIDPQKLFDKPGLKKKKIRQSDIKRQSDYITEWRILKNQ